MHFLQPKYLFHLCFLFLFFFVFTHVAVDRQDSTLLYADKIMCNVAFGRQDPWYCRQTRPMLLYADKIHSAAGSQETMLL